MGIVFFEVEFGVGKFYVKVCCKCCVGLVFEYCVEVFLYLKVDKGIIIRSVVNGFVGEVDVNLVIGNNVWYIGWDIDFDEWG